MLSGLAAITILARRLSLPKFGSYGLLVSLTSYVIFIQGSIETAAVKAVAEAVDQPSRDRAFSTAFTLYVLAGLISGGLLALVGITLVGALHIPVALRPEARWSILALSAVTAIGWPFKVFHDVLRGSGLFVACACAEGIAYLSVAVGLIALALTDARLWLLVAVGAAAPLGMGVASVPIVLAKRLPFSYRREAVSFDSVRRFAGLSVYVFLSGIAGLVIYSLDRMVIAVFRSPSSVGLYEGPARAHNFVAQVDSALVTPVLPASARYEAIGDVERARDLLVRGMRYTLATIVPLTIALMILAKPILTVWLGPKYAVAATAMTLLVAYWLVNGNTSVAARMLITAGKARTLTVYASVVACVNLGLSIALTPSLGIDGVVLGTTVTYVLGFPFFLRIVLSTFPVRLGELAREVWLPAYLTGGVVAAILLAVRLALPLDTLPRVLGAGVIAVLTYWAIYYRLWLRPGERALVRALARTLIRL